MLFQIRKASREVPTYEGVRIDEDGDFLIEIENLTAWASEMGETIILYMQYELPLIVIYDDYVE